jgi:hypothetical protein
MKNSLIAIFAVTTCLIMSLAMGEETPIHNVYSALGEINEFCYQGVVYVKFGYSSAQWGSVKFGRDGKVQLCQNEVIDNNSTQKNRK